MNLRVREHMHYRVPHEGIEFEIPDSWWVSAEAVGFSPSTVAYVASSCEEWPTTLVSIMDVEAPRRNVGIVGLNEDRTVSLLKAFRDSIPLPPLEVYEPSEPKRVRYRVQHGFHRYYASIAAGFSMLPVSVRPFFDFSAP